MAPAQCGLDLHDGGGRASAFLPGLPIEHSVEVAVVWDPDGVGPASPWLVVGGAFDSIGTVATTGIAAWDPATRTWHALGNGVGGRVLALAVTANGALIVGGQFATAGSALARNVALWNGSQWSAIGAGLPQPVYELAVRPTGEIAAASRTSQQAIGNLDLWNGSAWLALPPWLAGTGNSTIVECLATMPSGQIVASISSSLSTGLSYGIGIWTGSGWTTIGTMDYAAWGLAVAANGDLIAVGGFTSMSGSPAMRAARWDGSTWNALGSGLDADQPAPRFGWGPSCVAAAANGDLLVGGVYLTAGGQTCNRIARWNGTAWSPLATGLAFAPRTVAVLPNGDVVAGSLAGATANFDTNLARFDGSGWGPVADGPDHPVHAAATMANGDLVLGGAFRAIGGKAIRYVAQRTAGTFHALGSGAGLDGEVRALAATPAGHLLAAGTFTHADGIAVAGIARWNGTAWSAADAGWSNATVYRLLARRDGSVVAFARGVFQGVLASHLAQWDGAAWTPLGRFGGTPVHDCVHDLEELANGDLLVGGEFTTVDDAPMPRLARWDGVAWTAVGCPMSFVQRLDQLRDGGVVVAGRSAATGMAVLERFDGSGWTSYGPPLAYLPTTSVVLPDGDLAIGGDGLLAGPDAPRVLRLDGSAVTTLLEPMDGALTGLHLQPDGRLLAFGDFAAVGTTLTGHYAELAPTCPATADRYGTGCDGSNGPVALAATALPWLGDTFRAIATGFGPLSIGILKVGLTQIAVPAASVFGQAHAGCTLLTTTEVLFEVQFPTAGEVHVAIPIPANPALVGLVGYVQVGNVEFDAQASITGIADSNGLRVALGVF